MSDDHEHDLGLHHDLRRLVGARPMGRRLLLGLFAGAGLAGLAGCASAAVTGGATEIPQETAGPFPGDGSNGPNVLTESGVVRSDIRSSVGSMSGAADGVPLAVELTIVDAGTAAARPGATVYLWHCDREGRYSLYDVPDQNYLRGVQEADGSGALAFTSIVPGAYAGRWPHIHFEVYTDLASATAGRNAITTSQLALPEDVCAAAYATDGYATSVGNLARSSLDADSVFRDGYDTQLATVTGDVTSGFVAALTVAVT